MFQNMKIRTKLILGFMVMVLSTMLVGGLGIIGLFTLSEHETALYNVPMQAAVQAEEVEIALHQQRVAYRDLYINWDDEANFVKATERLERYKGNFVTALGEYGRLMEYDEVYASLKNIYEQTYLPHLAQYEAVIYADTRDNAAALRLLDELPLTVDLVEEAVFAMVTEANTLADTTQADDTNLAEGLILALVCMALFSVAVGVFLALFNARLIARPTVQLVEDATRIALGDVAVQTHVDRKDEIGMLAKAFDEMVVGFQEQARVLGAIADGDYSVEMAVLSEKDVVGQAIVQILHNNNAMMAELRTASGQVSTGAEQIAQGAQSLATGSSEQAATLEQLSAAISEVLNQSENNTKQAEDSLVDVQKAGQFMSESMESMGSMTTAMQEISDSSQSISKVIKVIDDIAFQTNILALNAAVEAARAGQHGKGFAVVADEVRNLASKSAEAAKETAALIESSVAKVAEGNSIVATTNRSIQAVAEIAGANAVAMQAISESSQRQSQSIAEVTAGIGQISSVVQENSATAQQSAASAEEMSAQAQMLEKIVGRFKLRNTGETAPHAESFASASPVRSGSKYDDTGFALKY